MSSAAQQKAQKNRDTIFVEDGELLCIDSFPDDQYVLRIRAPKCAATAQPGSFVHLSCDAGTPMRRPLSIMRVEDDCIELLYKIAGEGLQLLSEKEPGATISLLGPIGRPFQPSPERPNALLIGGGVGIPPMIFIADTMRRHKDSWTPLALLGSEIPFPFTRRTSALATPWLDDAITRTMPLLEEWGIPCRLATRAGFAGCFDGYVTQLAEQWLSTLSASDLKKTEIFSCGPVPMLKTVATLAQRYDLPCQVSLEEFMACAVGGCAGCTVLIKTPEGEAMKRVCVDGPVFDAKTVNWQEALSAH